MSSPCRYSAACGFVVGGGDAVQARLAPLKCPLVLPGLSQRLDHVVDGPQPCRPGVFGVETRP